MMSAYQLNIFTSRIGSVKSNSFYLISDFSRSEKSLIRWKELHRALLSDCMSPCWFAMNNRFSRNNRSLKVNFENREVENTLYKCLNDSLSLQDM